jgi:hypothetical protein
MNKRSKSHLMIERMNQALLITTVTFRVANSFQLPRSSSSSSWANSRWHRHTTPASRNIHNQKSRINILLANFGIASEDEAEVVINDEASVQDTVSSASVDTDTPSRLTGFSAEGRPRPYNNNNNNAESNAEETSSTATSKIEVPSPSSTSSVTTVTSPNTALPIDIQSPYNALNVEDFGLIPLVIIGISLSLALGIYFKQMMNNDTDKGLQKQQQGSNFLDESKSLLTRIKNAGTAGAISYALWEAAFWGLSIPVCLFSYRQVTGHWPNWQDGEDVRKVGLEAFAFVNIARLAVPIRIGLALSTIPWVEQNIVNRFNNRGLVEVDPNEDADMEFEEAKVDQSMQRYDSADNNTQTIKTQRVIRTSDGMSVVVPLQSIATESSMIVRYDQSVGNRDDELINADDWNDGSFGEYCEPGKVNQDCAESIRGYLDSLASTSAIATDGEVKAIVGYLDSLSSNVSQNNNTRKGFVNYLDALSSGYIPPPSSATTVANYLDALSGVATIASTTSVGQLESGPVSSRIKEVEERLNRIESSITRLPDDIIRLLVDGRSPDI